MTLVRIHPPPWRKLGFIGLELLPRAGSHHELSSDHFPACFPIESSIVYDERYRIYPRVVSDECKPAVGHGSELVLVLNESVVIKLIFINRALLVKGDGVARSQFLDWDDRLFHLFYFDFSLNMSLEGIEEKAV